MKNLLGLLLILLCWSCQRELPPPPEIIPITDTVDCVGSIPTFPFDVEAVKDIFKPRVDYINYEKCLHEIFDFDTLDRKKIKFQVDKSDYSLAVYYKEQLLKMYPVVFGPNPRDDKLQIGDGRTPEGDFIIQAHYPHSRWQKFMWLNYPTPDSWRKHSKAKAKGTIADFVEIGGEIGIHGVPEDMDHWIDRKYNWTAGCVSLKNSDVNELYKLVSKRTPINIKR